MCVGNRSLTFKLHDTKLQDVKDSHLAIAPWMYGSIPIISGTLPGTSPKVYEVLKSDDQLQQLLLNYYQRKAKMEIWIITREKPREERHVPLESNNIINMRRARAVAVERVKVEQKGWDWRDNLSMFRRRTP